MEELIFQESFGGLFLWWFDWGCGIFLGFELDALIWEVLFFALHFGGEGRKYWLFCLMCMVWKLKEQGLK